MRKKYSYLKLDFYKIDDVGCHILLRCRVNGVAARFIIDTGASRTVVDEKAIPMFIKKPVKNDVKGETIALGSNSIDTSSVVIKELTFGKTMLVDYECAVLDLANLTQSYASLHLPVVHGLIGGDVLSTLGAQICYDTKKIRFTRR